MKRALIAVDGASKGNPGPAGIGVVIADESGKVLREISQNIGQATNNFAEYTALLRALSEALEMGFTHLSIQTDSELMARQINGQYRVKHESIIPLYESAKDLLRKFQSVTLRHVLRGENKLADKLASQAASGAKPAKPEPTPPVPEAAPVPEVAPEPSPEFAPLQPALDMGEAAAPPQKPTAPPQPEEKPLEGRKMQKIPVRTSSRSQFVDITREIQDAVRASGVTDGVCCVYVPHTTAGITINENADPDVTRDIIDTLNRLVPESGPYRHVEGNSDAHLKASMMGFSVSVFIENGRLILGTWQGIYFCEFDGPRSRQVYVKALGG